MHSTRAQIRSQPYSRDHFTSHSVMEPRHKVSEDSPHEGNHDRRPLVTCEFSYYIKHMSTSESVNGVPVTEAQIAAWAAEAEAGYNVNELKERRRGRPGRGAEPSQVVALRLTPEELAAIDARATRESKTRSEAIREALASYVA